MKSACSSAVREESAIVRRLRRVLEAEERVQMVVLVFWW